MKLLLTTLSVGLLLLLTGCAKPSQSVTAVDNSRAIAQATSNYNAALNEIARTCPLAITILQGKQSVGQIERWSKQLIREAVRQANCKDRAISAGQGGIRAARAVSKAAAVKDKQADDGKTSPVDLFLKK